MRQWCVSLLDALRSAAGGAHAANAPSPPTNKDLLRIPPLPLKLHSF
jgi:hypothetical protein